MSDAMVKFAGLYEHTSKKGNPYFVGRVNATMKLVMLKNMKKEKDGDPDWHIFLTPGDDTRGAQRNGDAKKTPAPKVTAADAQAPLQSGRDWQPGPGDFNDELPI